MIRGVLFDLDGVILDTERLGRGIYLKACAEAGYSQMDEALYSTMLGKPQEEGYVITRRVLGEEFPAEQMFETFRTQVRQLIISGAEVCKPGLTECMDGLKARGLRIALATSTKRFIVEEYIQHIPQLQNVFDAMVCSVEAGRG